MDFQYEKNRIFALNEAEQLVAEITFPETGPGEVTIDRTFVDDSLRGQGVAGKLVEEACKEIKKQNKKMAVTCSYAAKWLEQHDGYDDLIRS